MHRGGMVIYFPFRGSEGAVCAYSYLYCDLEISVPISGGEDTDITHIQDFIDRCWGIIRGEPQEQPLL